MTLAFCAGVLVGAVLCALGIGWMATLRDPGDDELDLVAVGAAVLEGAELCARCEPRVRALLTQAGRRVASRVH